MSESTNTAIKRCKLCGKSEAKKKNSHIVPSFLVAQFASYDNSYKRDKELMFSISPACTKVYTGSLPSDKIESTFDTSQLTDERINEELKDNFESEDCILCPECESDLSKYLETPYADILRNKREGNGEMSYFFWLSIIWRMCISSREFGFDLDTATVNLLHNMLVKYLQQQKGISLATHRITEGKLFKYQILICPDYCKNYKNGCQFCKLDGNVLTFIVGDEIVICYFNACNGLPDYYTFQSVSSIMEEIPVNTGVDNEKRHNISPEQMTSVIADFKDIVIRKVIEKESDLIANLWFKLGISDFIPIGFIKAVIKKYHSKSTKIGDRGTIRNLAESFQYCLLHKETWV